MPFCQSCGTKLEAGQLFCPNCGGRVQYSHPAGPEQGSGGTVARLSLSPMAPIIIIALAVISLLCVAFLIFRFLGLKVGPETYFEVFPAAAMVVFACFAATPARKKASLMIIPAALYYILLIAGLIIYRFGPWFEPTVYYFIMLLLSLATSCVYALTLAGTIRRKAPAAICIGVMALLTLIQDYLMPFQTIGLAKYLHISLSNSLFLLLHVATDITPFLFLISLLTIVLNLEKRAVTASGGRPI